MDKPVAQSVSLIEAAYAQLAARVDTRGRVAAVAQLILTIFDQFYAQLCEYPYLAKRAFETMDPHASIEISRERLVLYSRYISEHGPRMLQGFPELADQPKLWQAIDRLYGAMISERYEADIAYSFVHSLRRNISQAVWRPVAYAFPPPSKRRVDSLASVYRRLPLHRGIDVESLVSVLRMPGFAVRFRDVYGDARRILRHLERTLSLRDGAAAFPVALDAVKAGFFRERAAFVVARWVFADGHYQPFIVALHNSPTGIYADAVLERVADIHNLFSSALANLHVTTRLYFQTCTFLFSLMPLRPLGHHYSTIGFNHVGKVAILNEIFEQLRSSGQKFARSPGAPGTVALGFTFDACSYHLKVLRDRPTHAYKWGEFPGVPAVLEKYRLVHEINRAGSMLDNVMYFNVPLGRDMFDCEFLAELCREAAGNVQVVGDEVVIRSLIVQLKIVPLPVYLQTASESETEAAMRSLGQCIRNNAATNIFNKDLDARNYGRGRYGRVLLFDYDAVERLTDVKIRTNIGREPGEELVPDWFFESGVIFLPEELEYGMQLKSSCARRAFRRENADLLTTEYWREIQEKLRRGEVPELTMYPRSALLTEAADEPTA